MATVAKKGMKSRAAKVSAQTAARVRRLARVLEALRDVPSDEQNAILRAAIELIEPDCLGAISGRPS